MALYAFLGAEGAFNNTPIYTLVNMQTLILRDVLRLCSCKQSWEDMPQAVKVNIIGTEKILQLFNSCGLQFQNVINSNHCR